MESRVGYIAAGLFALVLSLALAFGVMWLASNERPGRAYDIYRVYFTESVAGLRPSSVVRFRGVEVGRVRAIRLAPNAPNLVQIELLVERGTPVRADTVAYLRNQGLTGAVYVELTGGRTRAPPLVPKSDGEYPVLPSGPSLFSRLDSTVTELAGILSVTLMRLNEVLDDRNRAAIRSALADIASVSRSLSEHRELIHDTLAGAREMVRHGADATARLPGLADDLSRGAHALEQTSKELALAGVSVRKLADTGAAELSRVSGQTVPEVNLLLSDLRDLSGSLRRLVEDLRENPAAVLVTAPVVPGPGEEKP